MSDDIHILFITDYTDQPEEGPLEILAVNGEEALVGRPIGALDLLNELEGRKGIFEECIIEQQVKG